MMQRRVVVVPGPGQAYRPPAYRPPPVSPRLGTSKLGQGEIKFNWESLGSTILFASLGAGALYGSGLLPDPMKTIGMVGGVGLVGYAAYSFLGSRSSSNPTVPGGTSVPILTPAQFSAIKGQFLEPKNGDRLGYNWFSDTYDVKVLISNPNPDPVNLTIQFVARESPYVFLFIPARVEEYVADTRTVVIPGNGNLPLPLSLPTKTSRWVANLEMDLILRVIRQGSELKDLDHVSFRLIG